MASTLRAGVRCIAAVIVALVALSLTAPPAAALGETELRVVVVVNAAGDDVLVLSDGDEPETTVDEELAGQIADAVGIPADRRRIEESWSEVVVHVDGKLAHIVDGSRFVVPVDTGPIQVLAQENDYDVLGFLVCSPKLRVESHTVFSPFPAGSGPFITACRGWYLEADDPAVTGDITLLPRSDRYPAALRRTAGVAAAVAAVLGLGSYLLRRGRMRERSGGSWWLAVLSAVLVGGVGWLVTTIVLFWTGAATDPVLLTGGPVGDQVARTMLPGLLVTAAALGPALVLLTAPRRVEAAPPPPVVGPPQRPDVQWWPAAWWTAWAATASPQLPASSSLSPPAPVPQERSPFAPPAAEGTSQRVDHGDGASVEARPGAGAAGERRDDQAPGAAAVIAAKVDAATRMAVCGSEQRSVCRAVLGLTGNETAARVVDLLGRPLKIVVVLVLAVIVLRLIRRALRRFTNRMSNGPMAGLRAAARAKTISDVLGSVAGAVVGAVASLTVLGELGINLGPVLAGAGVAGVAFGFGAQSLVKDFLSGLFMLIEDQYGVGDSIDVGVANGVVESVTLRTTVLRDLDGVVWHIPNGEIRRVGNKSQQWARAVIDVDVSYDADVEEAQALIKVAADETWQDEAWKDRILEEPTMWGVERIRDDIVTLRLVIKTVPGEQANIAREVRLRAKQTLDAAGIPIPKGPRLAP